MSHHIVEVIDLEYKYPDGTSALNGISFRIEHGESIGIIGANGAGKSTLLAHLSGCLIADKGKVLVGDILVTKESIPQIRKNVGTIFQDPNDQLFMPTVQEDVAFGPVNMKLSKEEVEKRVSHALEVVSASHLRDRPPHKLSGGEKRRVAIATVLSMTPDILIMDEPTDGLDSKARRNLMNMLHGFTHTKIITSHDLDMILELCSRTIILLDGCVVIDGNTSDVLNNHDLLSKSNLEPPLSLQGCPICKRCTKNK